MSWLGVVGAILGSIAGIYASVHAIVKYNAPIARWFKRIIARHKAQREVLDNLMNNSHYLFCSEELQARHDKAFEDIKERLDSMDKNIKNLDAKIRRGDIHNIRQDREIERSRDNRDLLTYSTYALIDLFARRGENGHIKKAAEKWEEYLRTEALRPLDKAESSEEEEELYNGA